MDAQYQSLLAELKTLIIKVANLQHLRPEDIKDNDALFRTGLGLDSIDVLELVVNLERKYGIKIRNDETGREALTSVAKLTRSV